MKLPIRPLALAVTFCIGSTIAAADSLSDIYELALKNDATLKRAEAQYRADIEIEKQALSTMFPQISSQTYYRKSKRDSDSFTFGNLAPTRYLSTTSTNQNGYSFTLSQKIFDAPAWLKFKSAKQINKQAQAQLALDQQDLIIRVARAYFNVLSSQDTLLASKATEVATKRQLEQIQTQFRAGLLAKTDLHEAKAIYSDTVVQRVNAEGNLNTSFEALTALTGTTHYDIKTLSDDFPAVEPNPAGGAEWVQFALKNNYALKAAGFAMEAAKQNASAEKKSSWPKVTGSFQVSNENVDGTVSSSTDSLFANIPPTRSDSSQVFSINMTMPIFSGGRISSRRRQAFEQYNAALQQKIETQRTIVRNTRTNYITVVTDVQRIQARNLAIVSARSALSATEASYNYGTRNIVDVLDAHRRLYNAIRDHANSRYSYVVDMLTLKQAAGTLSPDDIFDIDQWLIKSAPTASKYKEVMNR